MMIRFRCSKFSILMLFLYVGLDSTTQVGGETIKVEDNDTECMEAQGTAVMKKDTSDDTKSSAVIIDTNCEDIHKLCSNWASLGKCETNSAYMNENCVKSCGKCVSLNLGPDQFFKGIESLTVYRKSIEYLEKEVLVKPEYAKVRQICSNKDKMCSIWASTGECDINPGYMRVSCALACRSCRELDINYKCPKDLYSDAMQPGDLEKMFERISDSSEDSEYAKFKPNIISRPSYNNDGKANNNNPWIITFDSFLTDEECDRLIQLGHDIGYERSTNLGKVNLDGTFERNVDNSRTSVNTWCENECYNDPLAKQVMERVVNVTKIDERNQEFLQLLRYDKSNYYKSHHDFISYHVERQPRARILTFFFYLNDVPLGGETHFTSIDRKVSPKKGKAVLWHNCMLDDMSQKDSSTNHEAMPVLDGVKYGANAWIHLRNFKDPLAEACI